MGSLTPTQRTLAAMRAQGRLCAIVEKYNAHIGPHGIRQDAFGFIDIIAIDPADGIVAIQSCGQSFSEHVRKLTEEANEAVEAWARHAPIELWGWRKVKVCRGKDAVRWTPRVADVIVENGQVLVKERT